MNEKEVRCGEHHLHMWNPLHQLQDNGRYITGDQYLLSGYEQAVWGKSIAEGHLQKPGVVPEILLHYEFVSVCEARKNPSWCLHRDDALWP